MNLLKKIWHSQLNQPLPAKLTIRRHPPKRQTRNFKHLSTVFGLSLLLESVVLQIITTSQFQPAPSPQSTGQVLSQTTTQPTPTPTQSRPIINTVAQAATTPIPTPTPPPAFTNPLRSYILTQSFSRYHTAVDMAATYGSPVYATNQGTVIATGYILAGGGLMVKIQHRDGYVSYYAHLSSIQTYSGATVNANTQIGRIGSTGWSTGPHLHFIVEKHGQAINPLALIQ